jgi:hypothetical protein
MEVPIFYVRYMQREQTQWSSFMAERVLLHMECMFVAFWMWQSRTEQNDTSTLCRRATDSASGAAHGPVLTRGVCAGNSPDFVPLE